MAAPGSYTKRWGQQGWTSSEVSGAQVRKGQGMSLPQITPKKDGRGGKG